MQAFALLRKNLHATRVGAGAGESGGRLEGVGGDQRPGAGSLAWVCWTRRPARTAGSEDGSARLWLMAAAGTHDG